MAGRLVSIALAACFIGALGACGAKEPSTASSMSSGDRAPHRFLAAGAKLDRCTRAVGLPAPDHCTMAYEDVPMRRCPEGGPGGHHIYAGGVSCHLARQLRLPVGAGGFEPTGRRGLSQNVYRPWLADGSYQDPEPRRAIGWTCFKELDPRSGRGIMHVCWNGRGGVFMFTFS